MKLAYLLTLPFFLPPALATVVTTTADEDNGNLTGNISLREAIKYSPTGSVITFAPGLSGQTIGLILGELAFPFPSPLTLTIDASNLPKPVTITGYKLNRVFTIPSNATVTMNSLKIMEGRASGDGGGIRNFGSCTLISCTLSGNSADSYGGGIFNFGTCTVLSSTLNQNSSSLGFGGGIANVGTCSVRFSTFSGNTAHNGNGGGVSNTGTGTCTLFSSTLSGNSVAKNFGGGVFNSNSSTLILTFSIVAGNFAPTGANVFGFTPSETNLIDGDPKLAPLGEYGGSVQTMHPLIASPAIDAGGTTDPGGTDTRGFPRFVDGNANGITAFDLGAVEAGPLLAVASSGDFGSSDSLRSSINRGATTPGTRIGFIAANFPAQTITLTQGELSIPSAANLFIDASNLSSPVTISGNNISRIFNIPASATVAMHSLKIVNGRATNDGGGIRNDGTCIVLSSTISGNAADNSGGGIFNLGTCTVLSSTLSGNSANHKGGGFFNMGTSIVFSSTFSGNSALQDGGGIFNFGTCSVRCSTFSGNTADFSGGGIFNSGSLNLTSSIVAKNTAQSAADITRFTDGDKTLIGGDCKLTPLGDYGGPTQTMPPLPGSPAIDRAHVGIRTTDQRGFPIGTIADIGATEYQGNTDLRRFWPLDWDGDGNPFGLEFALGTNPLVSDRAHPANLNLSGDPVGRPVLTFGRNSAVSAPITWRVTRSTTLLPGSFTEIFRHIDPANATATGSSASVNSDSFQITDTNPPPGKAFYRVEAISP